MIVFIFKTSKSKCVLMWDVSTLIFDTAFSKRGATGLCGHLQVIKTVYVQGFHPYSPEGIPNGFCSCAKNPQKLHTASIKIQNILAICVNFKLYDYMNHNFLPRFLQTKLLKGKIAAFWKIYGAPCKKHYQRKASGFGSGVKMGRKRGGLYCKKKKSQKGLLKRQIILWQFWEN